MSKLGTGIQRHLVDSVTIGLRYCVEFLLFFFILGSIAAIAICGLLLQTE